MLGQREPGSRGQRPRAEQPLGVDDGYVLAPVDRVRDRARLNRGAERFGLPQNLSRLRIERAQHLRDVAPEHEPAGRREHRAVAGRAAFVQSLHLARAHVDLREPREARRVRARP